MKKFGIEIRKANSLPNLYADVERTLQNAGIPRGEVTSQVQTSTVAHALQRMLKPQQHFSICTIDECIKVCSVVVPKERYEVYHAHHCMHWNEMEEAHREVLIAMLLDDFRDVLNPAKNEIIELKTE